MHALAGQRVQIGREGRDQRLALAGLHLRDIAVMQEIAALQLHVEGPQPQRAPRRLAAIGEGLRQQVIQALALGQPRLELFRLGDQPLVAQRGELRLQRVDLCDDRARRLDLALVRRAEHLPRERSETQHIFSVAPIDRIV
jgi:hypothetical protein